MKLALISLGGESSNRILQEAKAKFEKVEPMDLRQFEIHANPKKLDVLYQEKPLEKFDCIYIRGSYKYALLQRALTRALQSEAYIPVSPAAFTLGHNKLLTILELQKHKVPFPKTYLAATTKLAKKLLEKINYPIIMKIPEGTHGKGVMFAESIHAARSVLDALEVFKQPYILQEYVETDATDIRAIVAGDKVIAAMKRKGPISEFRANIHAGGYGILYKPDFETEQIAVMAAKAIGADICAVDILEAKEPVVIEVNLSPGLKGIMKATKENVAKYIADFLAKKTKEFIESQQAGVVKKELTKGKQEILTSLDIKSGMIKLPKLITEITKFNPDDEVIIVADKGNLEIKKHKIQK